MRLAAVVALGLLSVGGCKKWGDKMESGRQALIDSATPCPAPATCTGSMAVTQRKVSTCSAPPASGKTYAIGDTVIVNELADTPTLGRVKAVKAGSYDIEWAEGVTNERPADKVIAQVCR
jgi:hypothetical protein